MATDPQTRLVGFANLVELAREVRGLTNDPLLRRCQFQKSSALDSAELRGLVQTTPDTEAFEVVCTNRRFV